MTPKWATELVERICDAAGVEPPEVSWQRGERIMSSGRYFTAEKRLHVRAGKNRRDQKLVLLHELAHHFTPGASHDKTFWRAAWALFVRFRLTKYALGREAKYRKASTSVARELGIRGALSAAKAGDAHRKRQYRPTNTCPMPADQAAAHGYPTPHGHYVGTIHRWTFDDGTFIDYAVPPR